MPVHENATGELTVAPAAGELSVIVPVGQGGAETVKWNVEDFRSSQPVNEVTMYQSTEPAGMMRSTLVKVVVPKSSNTPPLYAAKRWYFVAPSTFDHWNSTGDSTPVALLAGALSVV